MKYAQYVKLSRFIREKKKKFHLKNGKIIGVDTSPNKLPKKYMKGCSTWLGIKEPTRRDHCTPARMENIYIYTQHCVLVRKVSS